MKEILYMFSDQAINDLLLTAVRDFKVLSVFIGGPAVYLLRRYVKWTPWKADDRIVQKLAEKLGVK